MKKEYIKHSGYNCLILKELKDKLEILYPFILLVNGIFTNAIFINKT